MKEAWDSDTEVGDLPRRAEIPRPDIPEGLKLTAKGSVKIADKKRAEDPEMKKIASAYRRSLTKVSKVLNLRLYHIPFYLVFRVCSNAVRNCGVLPLVS